VALDRWIDNTGHLEGTVLQVRAYGTPLRYQSRSVTKHHVQEELVPFVLENLGCAGDENSLLECPIAIPDYDESFVRDYDSPAAGFRGSNYDEYTSNLCDPYRGTRAKVACGMLDSAGVLRMMHECVHDIMSTAERTVNAARLPGYTLEHCHELCRPRPVSTKRVSITLFTRR